MAGSIVTDDSLIFARLNITSPTAAQQAMVDAAIVQAEGVIQQVLKYDPVYRRRVEYMPLSRMRVGSRSSVWDVNSTHAFKRFERGASGLSILVRHIPIRTIHSLTIEHDGRHGTAGGDPVEKTEGVDFWPKYDCEDDDGVKCCRSPIIESHGIWPDETGTVRLDYTAGYKEAEFAGTAMILNASAIVAAIVFEATRRAIFGFQSSFNPTTGTVVTDIESERLGDYSYSRGASSSSSSGGGGTVMSGGTGVHGITFDTMQMISGFINYAYQLSP